MRYVNGGIAESVTSNTKKRPQREPAAAEAVP
jgi:hypothetical protein